MTSKLPNLARSSGHINKINTTIFVNSDLLTIDQIVTRIMGGFLNDSILSLYAFSDIQLGCLSKTIKQIIQSLYIPIQQELISKDGFSAKKLNVGSINILNYNLKILNTFNTFGLETNLELKIPIKMFYNLYVQHLCDYYEVENSKSGKNCIKMHLNRPNKPQMELFFKSLSQTNLLVNSQRCSSLIDKHLIFSINTTFLKLP